MLPVMLHSARPSRISLCFTITYDFLPECSVTPGRPRRRPHTYIHTYAGPDRGVSQSVTRLWTGLGTGLCATVDWLATLSDRFLPPQARDQIVRASQGFLV